MWKFWNLICLLLWEEEKKNFSLAWATCPKTTTTKKKWEFFSHNVAKGVKYHGNNELLWELCLTPWDVRNTLHGKMSKNLRLECSQIHAKTFSVILLKQCKNKLSPTTYRCAHVFVHHMPQRCFFIYQTKSNTMVGSGDLSLLPEKLYHTHLRCYLSSTSPLP